MSLVIGYGRVSDEDQNLEIQEEQLRAHGCDRVLMEKVSGKSMDGRDALKLALSILGKGDTLVVTKLDRLARNTLDMLTIITQLGERGVGFKSLAEPWADTTSAAGKLMLTVMSGVAQFDRERIKERQMEGIAKAKAKGVYRGKKRKITAELVRPLKAEGLGPAAIARQLGCSRMSVYRTGLFANTETPICVQTQVQ